MFEADREGKLSAHHKQYSLSITCALVWIYVHAWMSLYTPVALYIKRQEPPILYNDTVYVPVVDFDNNPMHVWDVIGCPLVNTVF